MSWGRAHAPSVSCCHRLTVERWRIRSYVRNMNLTTLAVAHRLVRIRFDDWICLLHDIAGMPVIQLTGSNGAGWGPVLLRPQPAVLCGRSCHITGTHRILEHQFTISNSYSKIIKWHTLSVLISAKITPSVMLTKLHPPLFPDFFTINAYNASQCRLHASKSLFLLLSVFC